MISPPLPLLLHSPSPTAPAQRSNTDTAEGVITHTDSSSPPAHPGPAHAPRPDHSPRHTKHATTVPLASPLPSLPEPVALPGRDAVERTLSLLLLHPLSTLHRHTKSLVLARFAREYEYVLSVGFRPRLKVHLQLDLDGRLGWLHSPETPERHVRPVGHPQIPMYIPFRCYSVGDCLRLPAYLILLEHTAGRWVKMLSVRYRPDQQRATRRKLDLPDQEYLYVCGGLRCWLEGPIGRQSWKSRIGWALYGILVGDGDGGRMGYCMIVGMTREIGFPSESDRVQ